jgi:hypothetical protein
MAKYISCEAWLRVALAEKFEANNGTYIAKYVVFYN